MINLLKTDFIAHMCLYFVALNFFPFVKTLGYSPYWEAHRQVFGRLVTMTTAHAR